MNYYLIQLRPDDCFSMDKEYEEKIEATMICPGRGCKMFRPEIKAVDVFIEDPHPAILSFGQGFHVAIIRKDFLVEFDQEAVRRDLYLGDVYSMGGVPMAKWRSYRGRRRIIVRGAKYVAEMYGGNHRKCDICGRDIYFCVNPSYLYPEPSEDAEIFDAGGASLVVTERIAQGIDKRKWKGLRVKKLDVLKEPLDGLPPLLNP